MTVLDAAQIKPIQRIKDEKFSIDKLQNYSLTIQVGSYDIQFVVSDTLDNRCLVIEDYRLKGAKTINGRLRMIKQILDDHSFFTAGFWKDIKLVLKTHKFTLVPNNYFIQDAAGDYLALNSEIKTSFEEVNYYQHLSIPIQNVFAAETKLCRWIESIYIKKNVHIIHQGCAFLEGILNHQDLKKEKSLYCLVDRGILHLLVIENKKLLFYNQYAAKSKEDYLKYVMLAFHEMKMDNKTNEVFIWGFIKQNSEELNLLKKYIRNISLGSRPSFLKYNYQFDEIEEHQYFDVLSGYLCD